MAALTLERLGQPVGNDAAIRRIQRLQTMDGAGDKIQPTYPGEGCNAPPYHVYEAQTAFPGLLRSMLPTAFTMRFFATAG
jgi:hypothetical protein